MTRLPVFTNIQMSILIDELNRIGLSVDGLAYTPQFATLYSSWRSVAGPGLSEREFYGRLLALRKLGKEKQFKKYGRELDPGTGGGSSLNLDASQIRVLWHLSKVVRSAGRSRAISVDGLPYSPEFERMKMDFSAATGLIPSNRDLWCELKSLEKDLSKRPA